MSFIKVREISRKICSRKKKLCMLPTLEGGQAQFISCPMPGAVEVGLLKDGTADLFHSPLTSTPALWSSRGCW